MGWFDLIRSEMPLEEPKRKNYWQQTKSVPTKQLCKDRWLIRDDGFLIKLDFVLEDRSDFALGLGPDKDDDSEFKVFADRAGKVVPFNGKIRMISLDEITGEYWRDIACFENDKCARIELEEYKPPRWGIE